MKYTFKLFILLLVLAQPVMVMGQTQSAALAKDKTWLKLLHMQGVNQSSKVTSPEFFISENGAADAQAELLATLNILQLPSKTERLKTMCKFPARYFWLSQVLKQTEIHQDIQACKKLQRWVGNNDEISLVLVSGYLGNPASTFGHTLLKLQSSKQQQKTILMDTAINYGAITPENEPTLTYVYKGITGGYKATFLDKYYYTQELVYSRLESRDMWAYTLNLDESKTQLLMYHIWELIGQQFDYYFLDENCAYQLADVLGLVLDEPIVEEMAWYVPSEALYRLEALDEQYRATGRGGIIKSVLFLPSSQRKLNEQLKQLSAKELEAMRLLMDETADVQLASVLKELSKPEQMNVLDAALSYYNYQYVKSGLNPNEQAKALKHDILLARFKLPVGLESEMSAPSLESPTKGSPPMLFGVAAAYSKYEKGYIQLHWSGYHQGTTGNNHLSGDALVLLDGTLGLGGKQSDVFLERLDFIRIRKLNNNQMMIKNNNWAWQMRVGLQRVADIGAKYEALASFGAGKTWVLNPSVSMYGMVDVSVHTGFPYLRLRPHMGLYADFGTWKSLWYAGVENTGKYDKFEKVLGGEIQYFSSNKNALVLKYEDEGVAKATVEVRWFW